MRYVGTLKDGVIISKGINYTDYVDENEVELTKEQYETIETPCRLVDGEFVAAEYPKDEIDDTVSEIVTEPTTEELLNIILGVDE